MQLRPFLSSLALALVFRAAAADGQEPSKARAEPVLAVKGEVARPLQLRTADLAGMPRKAVRAKDHDGREAVFEGVLLGDVLRKAGVAGGVALRGEMLSYYLLVQADDGYRAVFALPELDPEFTDEVVLLADRRDGKALDDREGPFRIVAPGEKRQARWVRRVASLEVRHSQADLRRKADAPPTSR
ncbi:Oxidoreductase molybdopterin binding domain protein [Aquisphaera giovannonii]|uniref:Oxidoreductase molybdopterin binding domain protein n=1 Tax=Aquisphaera giovannonii TaxID=406548 RepID=A0A5B9W2P2_9BACT|nr:molybdopterin-dependent oxidoreductase [Aquisphaera giovannonii]QEH34554.1 Oxidoreductase molybdopterin binding domain protein [Aquisphaera giovannonii]